MIGAREQPRAAAALGHLGAAVPAYIQERAQLDRRARARPGSARRHSRRCRKLPGADHSEAKPIRIGCCRNRMLLFAGETPGVGVDRHVVAPGRIGHRGGPGVDVMQQPLQEVRSGLAGSSENSGLVILSTIAIRYRIIAIRRFQYGTVSIFGRGWRPRGKEPGLTGTFCTASPHAPTFVTRAQFPQKSASATSWRAALSTEKQSCAGTQGRREHPVRPMPELPKNRHAYRSAAGVDLRVPRATAGIGDAHCRIASRLASRCGLAGSGDGSVHAHSAVSVRSLSRALAAHDRGDAACLSSIASRSARRSLVSSWAAARSW